MSFTVLIIVVVGLVIYLIVNTIFSSVTEMYYNRELDKLLSDFIEDNKEEIQKTVVEEVTSRIVPLYWNAIYSNLAKHEDEVFARVAELVTENINKREAGISDK